MRVAHWNAALQYFIVKMVHYPGIFSFARAFLISVRHHYQNTALISASTKESIKML